MYRTIERLYLLAAFLPFPRPAASGNLKPDCCLSLPGVSAQPHSAERESIAQLTCPVGADQAPRPADLFPSRTESGPATPCSGPW